MSEWWENSGVEAQRRTDCWYCDAQLTGPPIFFPWGSQGMWRGRPQRILAMQCCALCCMREYAIVEAKDEGRRFVDIERERCVCGRAQVGSIGECITCHREKRMLDKQMRDIKLARRILASIRKEIKIGKAALNGGAS